jgi:hypothetical protein
MASCFKLRKNSIKRPNRRFIQKPSVESPNQEDFVEVLGHLKRLRQRHLWLRQEDLIEYCILVPRFQLAVRPFLAPRTCPTCHIPYADTIPHLPVELRVQPGSKARVVDRWH